MKKSFIKYLLVGFVLLTGCSQLYAQVFGKTTGIKNTDKVFLKEMSSQGLLSYKYESHIAKTSLTHFEKLNCEIEITDTEDDETSSLKKYFKASPYFAKSTANPQIDSILEFIQQASFLKKFSHLISCKRYILLQVIRI